MALAARPAQPRLRSASAVRSRSAGMPGRPGISGPSMPPPSGGSATGIGWVSRSRNNCPAAVADVDTRTRSPNTSRRLPSPSWSRWPAAASTVAATNPVESAVAWNSASPGVGSAPNRSTTASVLGRLAVDEPGDGVGEHRVVHGWSKGPGPAVVGKPQPSRPCRPVGRLLVELGAQTGGRRSHRQTAAAVHIERGERRRRYGVRQQVDRSGIKHDSSLDGPSHGLRSAATLGSAGRAS